MLVPAQSWRALALGENPNLNSFLNMWKIAKVWKIGDYNLNSNINNITHEQNIAAGIPGQQSPASCGEPLERGGCSKLAGEYSIYNADK